MEFNVLALPNNGIQYLGFLNTGIQCFAFPTNCGFGFFFLTLEFYTLDFPNIGIKSFCFSKIGIQCFSFSKPWNSGF